MGSSAFYKTYALTEIDLTVLTNLKTIAGDCFSYNGLITAKIPASVTSIGGQNFMDCDKLKDVWIYGTSTKFSPCSSSTHQDTKTFNNNRTVTSCEFAKGDPDLTIHIPASAVSFYTNSDNGWGKVTALFETVSGW